MKKLKDFGVDFEETSLVNGVKLYSFYKPNSPIYFRVYFYAGSQFDGDKPGLAHFCEHLLTCGTVKYPTKDILSKKIEEIGGRRNAFTNRKNLWITLDLADKTDLADMFEIVDQILNKSIMTLNAVEKEKGVVLAEQTRKISNPASQISDLQSTLLFQDTNIENPVLGFDAGVKKITMEDIQDYFDKYITHGQVAYFISGDFDLQLVTDSLNKINSNRLPIRFTNFELPIIIDKKELIQNTPDSKQNYISLSTRISTIKDNIENISGDIVNCIFGRGNTSRLNKALRNDTGLVYGVVSDSSSNPEYASFSINTNCKVTDTGKVIEIIQNEFKKMTSGGIEKKELERAKRNIQRNIKFNSETAGFWVESSNMKELTSNSNPILPDEYIEILNSITVENVNFFIKKYLAGKELLLAGIGDFSKDIF